MWLSRKLSFGSYLLLSVCQLMRNAEEDENGLVSSALYFDWYDAEGSYIELGSTSTQKFAKLVPFGPQQSTAFLTCAHLIMCLYLVKQALRELTF